MTRARRCDDRIVSLAQPHVRPIVCAKAEAHVEFKPKVDAPPSERIARMKCVSFDAYHEGRIAIAGCERPHGRHGYPATLLIDRAYL